MTNIAFLLDSFLKFLQIIVIKYKPMRELSHQQRVNEPIKKTQFDIVVLVCVPIVVIDMVWLSNFVKIVNITHDMS